MLVTLVLVAAPAGAGVCVQSSGRVLAGEYVMPENAARNESRRDRASRHSAQREECDQRFSPYRLPSRATEMILRPRLPEPKCGLLKKREQRDACLAEYKAAELEWWADLAAAQEADRKQEADAAEALSHCLEDVAKAEQEEQYTDPGLEAAAARVADAACTNDPGLFSQVHVLVYEDATIVTLITLIGPAGFRPLASKLALAYGAVPLRQGAPVLVEVRPLRLDGWGRPLLRAVVRGGKEITWLLRP
jgi:hypothetical protein